MGEGGRVAIRRRDGNANNARDDVLYKRFQITFGNIRFYKPRWRKTPGKRHRPNLARTNTDGRTSVNGTLSRLIFVHRSQSEFDVTTHSPTFHPMMYNFQVEPQLTGFRKTFALQLPFATLFDNLIAVLWSVYCKQSTFQIGKINARARTDTHTTA